MRKILAIALATLFVVGFVDYASAAAKKKPAHTQASCDKYCATRTGGRRMGKLYEYCMSKCLAH
jgi:hypothetical protein